MEVLESGALYGVHTTGIILPHTVEVIMADALYQPNGYVQQVFIPSSVKYLASYTGTVYTDMSEEEITSLYGEPWGPIYADICAGTVTLNDGENYYVTGGLKPGDKVVIEGVQALSDGQTITPITPAEKEAAYKKALEDQKSGNIQSAFQ